MKSMAVIHNETKSYYSKLKSFMDEVGVDIELPVTSIVPTSMKLNEQSKYIDKKNRPLKEETITRVEKLKIDDKEKEFRKKDKNEWPWDALMYNIKKTRSLELSKSSEEIFDFYALVIKANHKDRFIDFISKWKNEKLKIIELGLEFRKENETYGLFSTKDQELNPSKIFSGIAYCIDTTENKLYSSDVVINVNDKEGKAYVLLGWLSMIKNHIDSPLSFNISNGPIKLDSNDKKKLKKQALACELVCQSSNKKYMIKLKENKEIFINYNGYKTDSTTKKTSSFNIENCLIKGAEIKIN